MTTSTGLAITPLERQHYQAIDDLIFHSYQLHTHLDWFDPLDWLAHFDAPVRLAWQGSQLVGILAVSPPFNRTAWLRIVALRDRHQGHQVFAALWHDLAGELLTDDVDQVYVLIMRNWIQRHLRELDFRFVEDVVTMQRSGNSPPPRQPGAVNIRAAQRDDLIPIADVDHVAFGPPWQMTRDELRQALRVAAIATVAEHEQRIIGYQISTVYHDDAHLARLAVDPDYQGQGIGALLLHDVQHRFFKRHLITMTVNTQASNLHSQRLYRNFGFYRNGHDLPVWSIALHT